MAPRAIWKGSLTLGTLNCPVALYSAVSNDERVVLHLVNRATGHRVRRDYVDQVTEQPVPAGQQVKAFEAPSGDYITLDPSELAATVPVSDKILHIEHFVRCAEIDLRALDHPYYLLPADAAGHDIYQVIVAGLRADRAAAIARAVLFRRVRSVLLRADGPGLVATTLKFDYELRAAEATGAEHKIPAEMLELAQHIIDTKRGDFDPTEFEDRYDHAVRELVEAKRAGRKPKRQKSPKSDNVVDLMDALRRSADLAPRAQKRRKAG
jgi:DNA end-binding protein Ku